VIWRLDNGARTYLPRMAGALTAITPVPSDAACYILTQADNTIRMVRPSLSFAPTHPVLLPSNRFNTGLCIPLMKMHRPANPLPCWLCTAEWVTHWRSLQISPMPRLAGISAIQQLVIIIASHGWQGPCHFLLATDAACGRQVNVAAMRVLCSVHGLRPRVEGTPLGTVAALVPGSGELALAGAGSVLQLFDAVRDRHIDRVQVRGNADMWRLCGRL
jgi:hypothetical protein